MGWNIIEAINIGFELAIVFYYFKNLLELKRTRGYVVAGYGAVGICLFLVVMETPNVMVSISVTFILLMMLANILYQSKFLESLFYSFLFIVLIFISEILLLSIFSMTNLGLPTEILKQGYGRLIGMIGTKVFYFWLSYYTCKFVKEEFVELSRKHWILTILTPLISIFVLMSILLLLLISESNNGTVVLVIAVLGLLYINWSAFDSVESYAIRVRVELLELLMEHEESNYKMLNSSYSNLRQQRHDSENQIAVMRELLSKGDKISAEKQLAIFEEDLRRNSLTHYSGNPYIDSILNIKAQQAETLGIRLSVQYVIEEINLDAIELMRILGNALDNAIEECTEIHDREKYIDVDIFQIDRQLTISIRNSSRPVDTANMATKKENKLAHGIGLKSMQTSVEKLNGVMAYKYEAHEFSLNLVLYNGSKK
ncbi:GHKL domain-containing protein [Tyzzerella sp. OttesenSCG-928-J15]|nr:GHKL domain-containing protein [Tyzzerella sp. OttesenSCG-928-J15]